tara:strand:+ start:57119 stop:58135 length:1017 start_codon:yes stop_codon:yes gene_type:complete
MILILLSVLAFAGEPDNFSGRNTPPQNEVVNKYIQEKLDRIASSHNKINYGHSICNIGELNKLLEDTFDRNWPDVYALKWEVQVDGPEDFDKSILKGTMRSQFMIPSVTLKLNEKNYSVGIDKIDHLFSHGYLFWKIINKDPSMPKQKVLNALKFGMAQENGTWGLKAAGQKSFGDLSANYLGMNFWRDLWNGDPSFFKCGNGQLSVQRKFKIEDYFDGSVDEAINCNTYENKEMAATIITRTEALGRKCPIDKTDCDQFIKKIPTEYQPYLLHPLCRGQQSNQVESPSALTTKDILDAGSALVDGGGNFLELFFPPPTQKSAPVLIKKGTTPLGVVR